MITDPSRFFGRAAETQKIFNALASPKPQCVSIIGDRRIGRSSLLQHILRSYPQQLPNPSKYRFAYLDLSRDTCRYPHQFYAEAAQAFGKSSTNSLSPQQFDDWLVDQNPQNTERYILLLDEFNVLQRRRDEFDDDFYDGLRSRANAGEITFVLATHVPLEEIAVANNFSSTFFGIFTPVDLNGFSYAEAKASVMRPANPGLQLRDFEMIRAWMNKEDNEYHPLKLNIAADQIWQALPTPDYEQLKESYQQAVDHAFGTAVHNMRRQQNWKSRWVVGWQGVKNGIDWVTGGKPYLALLVLLAVVLLILGAVNGDQILAGLSNLAGIPTVTPTPTLTPTPMPTPIP